MNNRQILGTLAVLVVFGGIVGVVVAAALGVGQ